MQFPIPGFKFTDHPTKMTFEHDMAIDMSGSEIMANAQNVEGESVSALQSNEVGFVYETFYFMWFNGSEFREAKYPTNDGTSKAEASGGDHPEPPKACKFNNYPLEKTMFEFRQYHEDFLEHDLLQYDSETNAYTMPVWFNETDERKQALIELSKTEAMSGYLGKKDLDETQASQVFNIIKEFKSTSHYYLIVGASLKTKNSILRDYANSEKGLGYLDWVTDREVFTAFGLYKNNGTNKAVSDYNTGGYSLTKVDVNERLIKAVPGDVKSFGVSDKDDKSIIGLSDFNRRSDNLEKVCAPECGVAVTVMGPIFATPANNYSDAGDRKHDGMIDMNDIKQIDSALLKSQATKPRQMSFSKQYELAQAFKEMKRKQLSFADVSELEAVTAYETNESEPTEPTQPADVNAAIGSAVNNYTQLVLALRALENNAKQDSTNARGLLGALRTDVELLVPFIDDNPELTVERSKYKVADIELNIESESEIFLTWLAEYSLWGELTSTTLVNFGARLAYICDGAEAYITSPIQNCAAMDKVFASDINAAHMSVKSAFKKYYASKDTLSNEFFSVYQSLSNTFSQANVQTYSVDALYDFIPDSSGSGEFVFETGGGNTWSFTGNLLWNDFPTSNNSDPRYRTWLRREYLLKHAPEVFESEELLKDLATEGKNGDLESMIDEAFPVRGRFEPDYNKKYMEDTSGKTQTQLDNMDTLESYVGAFSNYTPPTLDDGIDYAENLPFASSKTYDYNYDVFLNVTNSDGTKIADGSRTDTPYADDKGNLVYNKPKLQITGTSESAIMSQINSYNNKMKILEKFRQVFDDYVEANSGGYKIVSSDYSPACKMITRMNDSVDPTQLAVTMVKMKESLDSVNQLTMLSLYAQLQEYLAQATRVIDAILWYQHFTNESVFSNRKYIDNPFGEETNVDGYTFPVLSSEEEPFAYEVMPARLLVPVWCPARKIKVRGRYWSWSKWRWVTGNYDQWIPAQWRFAKVVFSDVGVFSELVAVETEGSAKVDFTKPPYAVLENGEPVSPYKVIEEFGATDEYVIVRLNQELPGEVMDRVDRLDGANITVANIYCSCDIINATDIRIYRASLGDSSTDSLMDGYVNQITMPFTPSKPDPTLRSVEVEYPMPWYPDDDWVHKYAYTKLGPFFMENGLKIFPEPAYKSENSEFGQDNLMDLATGLGIADKVCVLTYMMKKVFGSSRVVIDEVKKSFWDTYTGGVDDLLSWQHFGLGVSIRLYDSTGEHPLNPTEFPDDFHQLVNLSEAFSEMCWNGEIGPRCNVVWCGRLKSPSNMRIHIWEFLPIGVWHKDALRFRSELFNQRNPMKTLPFTNKFTVANGIIVKDGSKYVGSSEEKFLQDEYRKDWNTQNNIMYDGVIYPKDFASGGAEDTFYDTHIDFQKEDGSLDRYVPRRKLFVSDSTGEVTAYTKSDEFRSNEGMQLYLHDIREYLMMIACKQQAHGKTLMPSSADKASVLISWLHDNPTSFTQLLTYYGVTGRLPAAQSLFRPYWLATMQDYNTTYGSDPVMYLKNVFGPLFYKIKVRIKDEPNAYIRLCDGKLFQKVTKNVLREQTYGNANQNSDAQVGVEDMVPVVVGFFVSKRSVIDGYDYAHYARGSMSDSPDAVALDMEAALELDRQSADISVEDYNSLSDEMKNEIAITEVIQGFKPSPTGGASEAEVLFSNLANAVHSVFTDEMASMENFNTPLLYDDYANCPAHKSNWMMLENDLGTIKAQDVMDYDWVKKHYGLIDGGGSGLGSGTTTVDPVTGEIKKKGPGDEGAISIDGDGNKSIWHPFIDYLQGTGTPKIVGMTPETFEITEPSDTKRDMIIRLQDMVGEIITPNDI
jgi:hypothetical protein